MKRIILVVLMASLIVPAAALAQTPRVTTGYSQPQVKPTAITTTGDGTEWFGGRTGHYSEPSRDASPRGIPHVGHLQWDGYYSSNAEAEGVVWSVYGPGSEQQRRFRIIGTVEVDLASPVLAGVYTQMTVTIHYNNRVGYAGLNGQTQQSRYVSQHSDGFYRWDPTTS